MESSAGKSSPSPSGAVSVSSPDGPTEELRSLRRESSSVSVEGSRAGGGPVVVASRDWGVCCGSSTGGGGMCGEGKIMLDLGWGINC